MVTVTDAEIVEAIAACFTRTKTVVEPSGACALATAMGGRIEIFSGRMGVVLSGGNISWTTFRSLIDRTAAAGEMVGCLACTPGAGSSQQALHDGVALFTST
ncbi:hypothetical protein [Nonomuraea sp. NPDC049504]|uniref:hypothetical protein n=1 Tax=Nonomuraea sp. NPDC049504 TaxID=3154729 RepID=UPI003435E0EB